MSCIETKTDLIWTLRCFFRFVLLLSMQEFNRPLDFVVAGNGEDVVRLDADALDKLAVGPEPAADR